MSIIAIYHEHLLGILCSEHVSQTQTISLWHGQVHHNAYYCCLINLGIIFLTLKLDQRIYDMKALDLCMVVSN